MIKFTFIKKKTFWQFGKISVLVNFIIIKKLKFCKKAQPFLCQFLWWEVNLRGLRGNLRQKNPAWVKGLVRQVVLESDQSIYVIELNWI